MSDGNVVYTGHSQTSLPVGWHQLFLRRFFGLTRGLYIGWPGPRSHPSSCLSFLGLTFLSAIAIDPSGDTTSPHWTWNFRVPADDKSWTSPFPAEISDHDVLDDTLGLITLDKQDLATVTKKPPKPRRRRSHGVAILPDEIVEPSDEAPRLQARRKSSHSKRAEGRIGTIPEDFGEIRSPPESTINGQQRRKYVMETRDGYDPPDVRILELQDEFSARNTPTPGEEFRLPGKRTRRRSSANSSISSARSTISTDSLPLAPSPPHQFVKDAVPASPHIKHRKIYKNPSGSSKTRTRSPMSSRDTRDEASPFFSPAGMMSPTDIDFDQNLGASSTEPLIDPWSSYPTVWPTSPPASTISHSSSTSSYTATSGLPPAPTSPSWDHIFENANGEFTVEKVRSVSETPAGRFYRVRWANTWESKSSLRRAMESGKYKVRETIESKYVNGQKLYHVRWKDTWEAEEEIGNIPSVQEFWTGIASGRREHELGL